MALADKTKITPEAAEAWQAYLDQTKGLGKKYAKVEPWAWALLCARLGRLKVNRGVKHGT